MLPASSGQSGVPGGGFIELQEALAAWTDDPGTPVRLIYAGTTNATGGHRLRDGVKAVLFDDPLGFAKE